MQSAQDARALPPREALRITKQLCHALGRAHASGIVHRDLKPSNVFLCDSAEETLVKLLDFGVAKETGANDVLSTTASVGTPVYMSPEQLTGERPVDHRSDLWALGVLVFEMLTGRRPFEGATAGALALAVHTLPVPSACALNPALPRAIDDWVARACARDPSARFDSAAGAARALEAVLQQASGAEAIEPPSFGPSTITDRGSAKVRAPRRSLRLALGAAALLAIPGVATVRASSLGAHVEPTQPLAASPLNEPLLPPPALLPATGTPGDGTGAEGPAPREADSGSPAPRASAARRGGHRPPSPGVESGHALAASVSLPLPPVPSGAPNQLSIPLDRK